MKLFKVRATQLIGDHTLLLTVVPKRARDRIKFYPGQYAAIGFKKQGRPSPVRCFSFVSSPGSTDAIQFAMRVKGDFTQAVAQLKPDETVFLYGPFGDFTIKQSHDQNIILLAGGIGVTPFISMVRRATEISLPNKITLLYSVSSSSAIPFRSEITQLEKLNPNFKAAYFVTQDQADKSPPSNFHYDRISSSTIMSYTGKDIGKYTFFLCGPQQFIKSLTTELKNNNVAEDKIITEEFSPAGVSANIFKQPESKVSRWTYGLTAASLLAAAGVFMTLDLARFVPKQLQSQAATTHTVSHHSQNTDDDFTENSSSPTSNDNSSTNSAVVTPTTPSTGNVNVVPTPSQTYRQPVTSVS